MSRNASTVAVVLLGVLLMSCGRRSGEPVTLQYAYSWNEDLPETRALLARFTQQTGIRVKSIPVPEYTREYLELARKLLEGGYGADLVNIDLIWSPILEPDLMDLKPYFTTEIAQLEPQLLPSYTVNGKLVAVPFDVPLGALEYRADLLREYGYRQPPKTWNELETMAEHIQTMERAKGVKDFWGYVWQGAAGEALTCNALEWQAAAGGGQIIESDRTISVNNPAAIKAWQRAKRWIGRISPPGVIAYRERDSVAVFDSGRAAFNRIWLLTPMTRTGQAHQLGWRSLSPPVVETGFARMPAGEAGSVGALGGKGTGISIHSAHRKEAIELLRYQLHALMQSGERESGSRGAPRTELSDAPSISGLAGFGADSNQRGSIVARPSIATGSVYKDVSKAYFDAVYSFLTGRREAPEAAAALEKQLIEITGFRAGLPQRGDKNLP